MGCGKVLVTGGAGFIGSHLTEELVREGFEVTVLDDLSTGRAENLSGCSKNAKVSFILGDIRKKAVTDDAISHHTNAIFHLAAKASVPYSVEHPKVTHEVNVNGTRNLLETCVHKGVGKLIYASSASVYGDPEYLPIDESHPFKPLSPYAKSKLKAEQICKEFEEVYGLKITILRPFNVYGPRQRNDQYSGVITKFIKQLKQRKPPIIYGDGSQTRDFIHVSDVVRAFILAYKSNTAIGRIFNVATGVPTPINNLANLLQDLLKAEGIKPLHVAPREEDIEHSYAEIEQAKTFLGFEPRITLKEGLASLLEAPENA